MIIGKADLVDAVAAKTGLSKKDAKAAIEATFESISESLVKGDKVSLVGFGSFEVKQRAERMGHDPRTKETKLIPAKKVPVAKLSGAIKDAVAKG